MRFNFRKEKESAVVNYEGADAFLLTPELELYTAVVTSSLSDQFYEKANDRLGRIKKLIAKNDPEFVAKLALYCRTSMNLRTIPLVITVELAKIHNGSDLLARLTEAVVKRADEITELLAYYAMANERNQAKQFGKLSKQLQKGLAASFNRFDEYQFAKYNRDGRVKLKDALFLVHPKAKDENQQDIFNKIINDELTIPYTWEVELSKLGQEKFASDAAKAYAFKTKWEELINSGKVGYMAILRNLRNILEAKVNNQAFEKVCGFLSDHVAVKNSKQLPFRFLSAYRELKELKYGRIAEVLTALEKAVIVSAENIKGYDLDTKVVIAADVSGSMQKGISAKSKVQYYDIGLMLAMMLQHRCRNVIAGMFGDKWKIINLSKQNILANVDEFHRREGEVGYSTNGYLVIRDLLDRNKIVDKIMMFTDCQLWNSRSNGDSISRLWNQYKLLAPGAKLYLFDLSGYGNTPLDVLENDVFLIAGWSDKIFDVLAAIEHGAEALEVINQVAL